MSGPSATPSLPSDFASGTVMAALTLSGVLLQREMNSSWKSAKNLVHAFDRSASPGQQLVFVEVLPYSASFYSNGRARLVKDATELEKIADTQQRIGVGLPAEQAAVLSAAMNRSLKTCGRYGRYVLLDTQECRRNRAPATAEPH